MVKRSKIKLVKIYLFIYSYFMTFTLGPLAPLQAHNHNGASSKVNKLNRH